MNFIFITSPNFLWFSFVAETRISSMWERLYNAAMYYLSCMREMGVFMTEDPHIFSCTSKFEISVTKDH